MPTKLRINEVTAKSILNPSRISGVTYAINPFVGCQHACAYCLHPSTRILTNKGFIEIQHIVNNRNWPLVVTHKGRFRPIQQTFHHFYDGPMRHIHLRYYRDFCVTPNHRILAIKLKEIICRMDGFSVCYPNRIDKGTNLTRQCNLCKRKRGINPKLVEANNLETGDFVIIPIPRDTIDREEIKVEDVIRRTEFSKLFEIKNGIARFKRGKSEV